MVCTDVDIAGEKGVGKALTYGKKYFLLKFFNIATDKDWSGLSKTVDSKIQLKSQLLASSFRIVGKKKFPEASNGVAKSIDD